MKHGPLNMDFTVYGPDAERMELGQRWEVLINGHRALAEVISTRNVDGIGRASTLRVQVTFETAAFPETHGTVVYDDTVGT